MLLIMIKKFFYLVCFIILFNLAPLYSYANNQAITTLSNNERDFQERLRQLYEELRCLVCQNQSLSDSHAKLTSDLRRKIKIPIRKEWG